MNDTDPHEYTLWNTPLSVLLRGRLGPGRPKQRFDPLAPVTESSLPEAAKTLITKVVKKTRLWKHEKQDIAEELLAHFGDGLDSGRSMDDLIAKFGDPVKAAKLMRRAKKRNRPLWWKFLRGTTQAFAGLVLIYLGVFAWLYLSHPSPTTDYIAQINAIAASAPVEQQAWPIYRRAFLASDFAKLDVQSLMTSQGDMPVPGDGDWPAVATFLQQHQDLLTGIREGSSRHYLGLLVGTNASFSQTDRNALGLPPRPVEPSRPPQEMRRIPEELWSDAVIAVLEPQLALLRKSAQVLALDLRDAAAHGDGSRVAADLTAMYGLARHAAEHRTLVNSLVGLGICSMAQEELAWVLHHYPTAIADQRVAILHTTGPVPEWFGDASAERVFLPDAIQRIYTDSGNGNGHLTIDGLASLGLMQTIAGAGDQRDRDWANSLPALAPVVATMMASRKDMTDAAQRYFTLAEQDLSRPAWQQFREPAASEKYIVGLHSDPVLRLRYLPVVVLAPSFHRYGLIVAVTTARQEAIATALALEEYRARTGAYPATLASLVPQCLPEVPLDLSTGQPLLYKLKDGKPLLYGRGLDGNDDGGTWVPEKGKRWPRVPSKGDWILYPEPTEPGSPDQ